MYRYNKYKIVYSVPGERNHFTVIEEMPYHRNYEEAVFRVAKNIFTYMDRYVEVYILNNGTWKLLKIYNKL